MFRWRIITIIGSQTAGADGNGSVIDPIKSLFQDFTGIGVLQLTNAIIQRIGIKPDIEAKATIKGIQEEKMRF